MKLLYLANIRMPTEKAHGLQIMQMCEAFAGCAMDVELLAAWRKNTPEMAKISDPYAYYGVSQTFGLGKIACIDLLMAGRSWERVAFPIQSISYTLVLAVMMLFRRADVYYTRDLFTLFALTLIKPRRSLGYEVHQRSTSGVGRWMQDWCLRRAGLVVTVTGKLADEVRLAARAFSVLLRGQEG